MPDLWLSPVAARQRTAHRPVTGASQPADELAALRLMAMPADAPTLAQQVAAIWRLDPEQLTGRGWGWHQTRAYQRLQARLGTAVRQQHPRNKKRPA
ncbi:MAG: hypothetical protein AAFX65_11630 [Cyanobacteria bacterium J06638_7]